MKTTIPKKEHAVSNLETHFQEFAKHIIGNGYTFQSLYGKQTLLYADWIASGRLYGPIEDTMRNTIGPMIANTHSFSSESGKASTYAYHHARQIIKKHVNAGNDDVLVTSGSGMTGVLSRLHRIMGLRWPSAIKDKMSIPKEERPVVFITHMEHHSNHVPWMETIADVVIVPGDRDHLVSPENLENEIKKYKDRPLKIGAFTACSNVTGIITPYYELAKIMHQHNGVCFVDFAASAPYVDINMHPADPDKHLDAIFFSPHKFLGGPGTCGVLVFNKKLYKAECPDVPGGGNVKWTDPWGNYGYHDDIEVKEDGGTPGFLQVMRTALAIRLKEKMNTSKIAQREEELIELCMERFREIPGLYVLGQNHEKRIGCISFGIQNIHYNLLVRLLNDRFGIQVRGGWSCASTYSHYLFGIEKGTSSQVIQGITEGNLTNKPGWVRLSLHPVTTNEDVHFICDAVKTIVHNIEEWRKDYRYNIKSNEFDPIGSSDDAILDQVKGWFVV